jgi:uncharacterized protein (DUF58 family)
MEWQEIISKLKRIEIRIRTAISSQMHGNYHSVFKGTGIEFSDVRDYQYGDEVRTIDWKVSAKGHGTYVRTFQEEKEQQVFIAVDISGSQTIGLRDNTKLNLAREIAGVLTLSAIKQDNNVGLFLFSTGKELYIKPEKGQRQAYTIIRKLYTTSARIQETNISASLKQLQGILKRKTVVILISDFRDRYYEKELMSLSRKHDLVLIQLTDITESMLPRMGTIPFRNTENGKVRWVNTSSPFYRKNIQLEFDERFKLVDHLSKVYETNHTIVETNTDYVSALIKLFQVRNFHKKKRG